MSFKNSLKYYLIGVRSLYMHRKATKTPRGRLNKRVADLIRNTHSIEKGLSIENPRLGFGHSKQKEMMELIVALKDSEQPICIQARDMALDSLSEYLDYHESKGYSDDFTVELQKFVSDNLTKNDEKLGGTITVKSSELCFDIENIERFFETRHSVREFSDDEIDYKKLEKALKLARKAPSACNRQGVRAYVLGAKKEVLLKDLAGVGGFADDAKEFIMITAKTGVYEQGEYNQYIVSPSIYAGYLSLTLHLYGFGACIIQREVVWSKKWEEIKHKLDIPEDEQMICLLAVGNLKDEFNVPLSYRLECGEVIKFLDEVD